MIGYWQPQAGVRHPGVPDQWSPGFPTWGWQRPPAAPMLPEPPSLLQKGPPYFDAEPMLLRGLDRPAVALAGLNGFAGTDDAAVDAFIARAQSTVHSLTARVESFGPPLFESSGYYAQFEPVQEELRGLLMEGKAVLPFGGDERLHLVRGVDAVNNAILRMQNAGSLEQAQELFGAVASALRGNPILLMRRIQQAASQTGYVVSDVGSAAKEYGGRLLDSFSGWGKIAAVLGLGYLALSAMSGARAPRTVAA